MLFTILKTIWQDCITVSILEMETEAQRAEGLAAELI